MPNLNWKTYFDISQDELWEWHQREGALDRLIPPFEEVKVLYRKPSIDNKVVLQIGVGISKLNWVAQITEKNKPNYFIDIQENGPFKKWEHKHSFYSKDEGTVLEDDVNYEIPFGLLGRLLGDGIIKRKLAKQFTWRHKRLESDLNLFKDNPRRYKIVLSGASGLVGTELINLYKVAGNEVIQVLRHDSSKEGQYSWSQLEKEGYKSLEGAKAWIHLGGDNISEGRWTKKKKDSILNSRLKTTAKVGECIAKLINPPDVWINASAIGYYGTTGVFDEDSKCGDDFLAQVCDQWEKTARKHCPEQVRLVIPRLGVVMSGRGAALRKIVNIHKWNLGGPIGFGLRKMSWIDVDDIAKLFWTIINSEKYYGVINAVSPNAVDSNEFTKSIDKRIKRKNIFRIPPLILKILFGEMATATILSNAEVLPKKLLALGFEYDFKEIDESLKNQLG